MTTLLCSNVLFIHINFLILLPLIFALALGIYLFFPARLVSRLSEWLGRKKKTKVILRETIQLFVSTKTHFNYSLPVCIKDVWKKNNKCMMGVGNSYLGWQERIIQDSYILNVFHLVFSAPWSPTASRLLPHPPIPSPKKVLSIFEDELLPFPGSLELNF